jgi:hypothetical protein
MSGRVGAGHNRADPLADDETVLHHYGAVGLIAAVHRALPHKERLLDESPALLGGKTLGVGG